MKKEEIKRDPVVDKILYIVSFLRNNLLAVSTSIVLIIIIVFYIGNESSKNEVARLNAIDAVDKLMVDFINSGANISNLNSNYINEIDSLNKIYPDSEEVNYLNLLVLQSDSIYNNDVEAYRDIVNKVKNNITNNWFKSQAYLISGDLNSDDSNFEDALDDYLNSLKFSNTNLQKAYVNYKLGLMYDKLDDLDKSYKFHNNANDFFVESNKLGSLKNDQQFNDWKTRNDIALNKLKIILKK